MRNILLILLAFLPTLAFSADDIANGKRLSRSCALCHGVYGQGTPGDLSPRLAGVPKEYLFKSTKDYVTGVRNNPTMVKTTGLKHMTDQDIRDIAAYYASMDLYQYERFDVIQRLPGSIDSGKELYNDECKTCHAKDGSGKPKKEAPPLMGQHGEYLFQSMKMFQFKKRIHDNDPEDDSFDEYSDTQLLDMVAYLTTLDNRRVKPGVPFVPPRIMASAMPRMPVPPMPGKAMPRRGPAGGLQITDITQTVAQMELKPGVSKEDAIEAMLSKATELNLKLVGRQNVSKELEARGVKSPYLSILQFCNPMDARVMVIANPIFSSYMPCRISLVEDQQGKPWLMMLNLDMLINSQLLPPEVVNTAIKVNQQMLEIMMAGATGEF